MYARCENPEFLANAPARSARGECTPRKCDRAKKKAMGLCVIGGPPRDSLDLRARRMHAPEMRSRSKNDGILRHRWPSQRLPRSPRRLNLFAKNPILRRKRFLCLAFDTPDQRSPRDRPKVWCFHSGRTLDCIKHTVDAQWTHSGLCKNIGIHDFAFRIK